MRMRRLVISILVAAMAQAHAEEERDGRAQREIQPGGEEQAENRGDRADGPGDQ